MNEHHGETILYPRSPEAAQVAADASTVTPSQADSTYTRGSGVQITAGARRFGEYDLLDEIARGGMGVVYRARQVRLNRTVALKMILAGQLAGELEVRRFHAEAEAAAQLDHPGIVPIYEVGQHEGTHFFSMGFVEGQSLAARVAAGPLEPDEAVRLLRQVADAVQYAHEHGVIHRDLKPANILLDASGHPKVTDFGLARRTASDSNLTGTGQVLGTPSFMPPEQASGDLDHIGPTSDVYSLGATLYCLLAGRPPFQSANPLDTLLQVLHREPLSPRQLNPAVSRDLETVTLKCLHKEPARRYASAKDFADELQRILDRRPIVARPLSAPLRAWRWCRRNPIVAGLSGLAVLLLVSVAVASSIAWVQSALAYKVANEALVKEQAHGVAMGKSLDEQKRLAAVAEEQRKLADGQRQRAERRLGDSLETVTNLLTKVGASRLAFVPQLTQLRRELLEQALAFNQRFLKEEGDNPAVLEHAGMAWQQAGEIYALLGRGDESLQAYDRAIVLFRKLAAAHPQQSELRRHVLVCLNAKVKLFGQMGDATRLANALTEMRPSVEELATAFPDDAEHRHMHATYQANRAQFALMYLQRLPQAPTEFQDVDPEALLRQSIAVEDELVRQQPRNSEFRIQAARNYNSLGVLLAFRKLPEACDCYRSAIALQESLLQHQPEDSQLRLELGTAYNNLSNQLPQAELESRRAAAEKGRDHLQKLVDEFPDVPHFHLELSKSCGLLGMIVLDGDRDDKPLSREDLADAAQWMDKSVAHSRITLKLQPGNPYWTSALRSALYFRGKARVGLNDHASAAADMTEAASSAGATPGQKMGYARWLAQCVRLAAEDTRLPGEQQQALSETYAQQSVAILKEALAATPQYAAELNDPLFDPIRAREGFVSLTRK